MRDVKVSIVIPLYNSEKYIDNCIRSALNQDYTNIEIIVVNDGSTDSSEEIVKKIKSKKIKFISQKNAGPSAARNTGIKNSSGDWILFLDSDDTLAQNAVSFLVKSSKDADFVIGGWNAMHSGGVKYFGPSLDEKLHGTEIEELGAYLLSCRAKKVSKKIDVGSIEGPVAKLYSSKIIKDNDINFPLDLRYSEDVCFNYNYLQYCSCVVTLNKTVYFASRHQDSLSNSQRKLMLLKDFFAREIERVNIKKWNVEKNVIYRYIYWTLEDLEKSSATSYRDFDVVYKDAKKIDFTLAEDKYLSKWKKLELKFLKFKTPVSYILFKVYNSFKKMKKRLKYGK